MFIHEAAGGSPRYWQRSQAPRQSLSPLTNCDGGRGLPPLGPAIGACPAESVPPSGPAAQVQSAADQRALAARRAARQVGSDEESMRTGDDSLHAARAWRRRGHLTPAKTRPSAPPLCLIRRKLAARVTKLQVASAAQVTQLAARVTLLSAVRVTQLAVRVTQLAARLTQLAARVIPGSLRSESHSLRSESPMCARRGRADVAPLRRQRACIALDVDGPVCLY